MRLVMKFALTVNCRLQFCVAVFLKQQKHLSAVLLFMWGKKSLKNEHVPHKVFASFLYTWLFEMIVGVLTTATSFSRCNPMWFLSIGLRQGSGLCSSSSRKYPGTEGTNQNRHETITADMIQTVWNELDYHVDVYRITQGAHIEHL